MNSGPGIPLEACGLAVVCHAPDPEPDRQTQTWSNRAVLTIGGLFLFRCIYLFLMPLGLCADEAYYWDWSRQPAWGYYSKPPMIAWLITLATSIGGHSEAAIRFPAAVLGTAGLWPVFLLGRRMFSARTGYWSLLLIATMPGVAALSMLMTIDAPFLCCWAWSLWLGWELLNEPRHVWRWVIPAMLATGLGLLSKQTMMAIVPLSILWIMATSQMGRLLKSPAVWCWWLGSAAFLTPVVWWNSQHSWITFQHTSEHFQTFPADVPQRLRWFLEFWAAEFGVVSPIACALMIVLSIYGVRTWSRQDGRVRFLLCFSCLPMLAVTILSFTRRVQPNWPAPFLLPAVILLAAWGCGDLPAIWANARANRWLKRAVTLSAVMTLLLLTVPFLVPSSQWAGGPFDATARLRGWKELAMQIDRLGKLTESADTSPLIISATGRGPVSLIAYYLPTQPRVYRWNPAGIVDSQHEIWGKPGIRHQDDSAIVITPAGYPPPDDLQSRFSQLIPIGQCSSYLGGHRWETFQVWSAANYLPLDSPSTVVVPQKNLETASRRQLVPDL